MGGKVVRQASYATTVNSNGAIMNSCYLYYVYELLHWVSQSYIPFGAVACVYVLLDASCGASG